MTPTSLVIAPPPSAKTTYEPPIPVIVYHTNPLTVAPDPPYLSLVLYLVRVTNKDKALVYDCPQELTPTYLQKEGPGVKPLSRTAIL